MKLSPVVIGKSVEGRPLEGYLLGQGKKKIALISGLHGNEPKAMHLVRALYRRFRLNFSKKFPDITLFILPVANPDGYEHFLRVNVHQVDLNRNWSCNWQPIDRWGAGGRCPFSEPETKVLRKYLSHHDMVIDYHTSNMYGENSGGYIMPGGRGQKYSMAMAKLLAIQLKYRYRSNEGGYPGLMIDFLNQQKTKACIVELFVIKEDEPDKRLIELHYQAIAKLIRDGLEF